MNKEIKKIWKFIKIMTLGILVRIFCGKEKLQEVLKEMKKEDSRFLGEG